MRTLDGVRMEMGNSPVEAEPGQWVSVVRIKSVPVLK